MAETNPMSFRLSDDAAAMLKELEQWLGLKRTGVVEVAVRRLHQSEARNRPKPAGTAKPKGRRG